VKKQNATKVARESSREAKEKRSGAVKRKGVLDRKEWHAPLRKSSRARPVSALAGQPS